MSGAGRSVSTSIDSGRKHYTLDCVNPTGLSCPVVKLAEHAEPMLMRGLLTKLNVNILAKFEQGHLKVRCFKG